MKLSVEEMLELIDMHGRTLIDASMRNDQQPIKTEMMGRLDRMRQLIQMLPDDWSGCVLPEENGDTLQ